MLGQLIKEVLMHPEKKLDGLSRGSWKKFNCSNCAAQGHKNLRVSLACQNVRHTYSSHIVPHPMWSNQMESGLNNVKMGKYPLPCKHYLNRPMKLLIRQAIV